MGVFGGKNVTVVLSPDAVSAAVGSGRRVSRSATIPIDRETWSRAWREGLIPLDRQLQSALRQIKAGSKPHVRVLAESPAGIIEVHAINGQGPAAISAAQLHSQGHTTNVTPMVTGAIVLAEDEHDGTARSHVLVAGEEDTAAQAVFAWISRAGGRVISYTPRAAAVLTAVFEHAAAYNEDERTALCYIDRGTTALVVMHEGELMLVRSVRVGYQALAEAYARAVAHEQEQANQQAASDDVEVNVTLDMIRAETLLFENGVPAKGAKITSKNNPLRRTAGPLLSPAVQRMCVEVKQTLRYGVADPSKRPARLVLCGPGANIPGLADALLSNTELDTDIDPATKPHEQGIFSAGTIDTAFAEGLCSDLALLPKAAARRLEAMHRMGALRTGAVAAAALLIGEAGLITLQSRALEERFESHAGAIQEAREFRDAHTQADEIAQKLNLAAYASETLTGDQPDWRALFVDVARAAGEDVEVTELRGFYDGDTPMILVTGQITEPRGTRQSPAFGRFTEMLQASPLITKVEIGSTNVLEQNGSSVRRFTLRCTVRRMPVAHTHPTLLAGHAPKKQGARP